MWLATGARELSGGELMTQTERLGAALWARPSALRSPLDSLGSVAASWPRFLPNPKGMSDGKPPSGVCYEL